MSELERPGLLRMLLRGAIRRCPLCGGKGAFFSGWYKRDDRCHTCGLLWERKLEGFELGSMTVNVIATFGTMLVTMGIGVALSYPDVAVVPIFALVVVIAIGMPIAIFPMTYSIWLAVDLFMRAPEPEELADAAAAVAAAGPTQSRP
ncbi:MAG: hypothetical protein KJS66_11100 [Acidobacteria bacterium]|nr:hypothetical protein [Acidobacteriota bacterium]